MMFVCLFVLLKYHKNNVVHSNIWSLLSFIRSMDNGVTSYRITCSILVINWHPLYRGKHTWDYDVVRCIIFAISWKVWHSALSTVLFTSTLYARTHARTHAHTHAWHCIIMLAMVAYSGYIAVKVSEALEGKDSSCF